MVDDKRNVQKEKFRSMELLAQQTKCSADMICIQIKKDRFWIEKNLVWSASTYKVWFTLSLTNSSLLEIHFWLRAVDSNSLTRCCFHSNWNVTIRSTIGLNANRTLFKRQWACNEFLLWVPTCLGLDPNADKILEPSVQRQKKYADT
jgi:hypothetical protein